MNKRGFPLAMVFLIAIIVLIGTIAVIKSTSITGNALFERRAIRTLTEPSPISPILNLTNHSHVTDPFATISKSIKVGGQQVTTGVYSPSYWSSTINCTKEAVIQRSAFPKGANFVVLEAGYSLESVSQTPDFSGVVVYQDYAFLSSPTSSSFDAYYFKAVDPQNKLKSATVYVTCAAIEPTSHLFSNKDY